MTREGTHTPPRGARAPHLLCGLSPDTPILLGFSGGADSSALLHILLFMREEYGFSLTLAHLDHGIRGEEAARDLAFCKREAERVGLELVVEHADVPTLAKDRGASLEEAARDARYDFFDRVMREREIPILVTAHHATDNLETLLFRLMRGTGSRGIFGMRPSRPFGNGFLVRPLLEVSGKELRDYCKRAQIPFVTDSTNLDTAYTRNRIRHGILPIFEETSPGSEARAARLARELREDNDALEELARELLVHCLTPRGLDLSILGASHASVRRRALVAWVGDAGCHALMHSHVDALLRLVSSGKDSSEVRLPSGLVAFARDGYLVLSTEAPRREASFCVPLSVGTHVFEGTGFHVTVTRLEERIKVHNLSTEPYIILNGEFDIINEGAYWRERREGDVILLRGMHRKLRKLQGEAGISPRTRRMMPLLCDREGVLWAPLVGVRDAMPVKSAEDACAGDLLICLAYENT